MKIKIIKDETIALLDIIDTIYYRTTYKKNYTILYKLLDNNNFVGSYHHNRAKQAYETVHHHMHAILQDGRRSSVWRLRLLSFSVWDADC